MAGSLGDNRWAPLAHAPTEAVGQKASDPSDGRLSGWHPMDD